MKDTEHNRSEDDFEVEVSDIPGLDSASDGNPISNLATWSSLLTWAPRFSPRQRAFQGVITAGVVMLALLFIIGGYIPARNIVALSLDSLIPTPTPALAPGADLFYIQRTLSWSTVSLDGHILPRVPISSTPISLSGGQGLSGYAPLELARGSHRFVWYAEPFEPISCTLSVPAASTDSCLTDDIARAPSGIYVKVITFLPSLDTLPVVLRTALIQTAQESLDALTSSETVQPGEHFFSRQQGLFLGTATQLLHATLRFQLDTDAKFLIPCNLRVIGKPCTRRLIQDCRLFCTKLFQSTITGEKDWDVFASIRSSWEYATPGGQIIAQDQPDVLIEHLVSLHISWDGSQWYVTILPFTSVPGGLACALARDKIDLNAAYRFAEGDFSKQVDWQFASGPNLATGCLAVATLAQNVVAGGVGTLSEAHFNPFASAGGAHAAARFAPLAFCLYRFGVLLAVNDVAHLYWPLMPLASPYEQSLAQHM